MRSNRKNASIGWLLGSCTGVRGVVAAGFVSALLASSSAFADTGTQHAVVLNASAQGGGCRTSLQPLNTVGVSAPVILQARTKITGSPLDGSASGTTGELYVASLGIGVRGGSCLGDDAVSGDDATGDEEIVFTFDRGIPVDTIILGLRDFDFAFDDPVLFLSTLSSAGYDIVITDADLAGAFATSGGGDGLLEFAGIPGIPTGTTIDKFSLRETSSTVTATSLLFLAPPKANLDQTRNGPAGAPISPGDWVNGNLNSSASHYLESYSVAYRTVMTDMPTGTPVTLTLGYDIKRSDKHALDYLTHYDRLLPHVGIFGHSAEALDPLIGVSGVSATTTTFPIPVPDTTSSPVPGEPATSFSSLPAGERVFTLFGGTITGISYNTNGDLTASQSETRIDVSFTVDSATAVLAWGGHIASRNDWGFDGLGDPRSAGGVSGSPYHMRLINWNLNNLGNQDRSLSADAITDPCEGVTCPGPTNSCDAGQACDSETGLCVEPPDPTAGTSCDLDGDLCTVDECNGVGSCVNVSTTTCPGGAGTCEAGEVCNPASGLCEAQPDAPAGTPCDTDGNGCTLEECDGVGTCAAAGTVSCPGPAGTCDGGQACDPGSGACVDLADTGAGTACDTDGNLCTLEECDGNGACLAAGAVICAGPANSCDGGQVCNQGSGLCVDLAETASGTSCEADGDLCTLDECDGLGSCVQAGTVSCSGPTGECDAGTACNTSNGLCEALTDPAAGTICEADGDLCTNDTCDGNGNCTFSSNVSCSGPTNSCDGGTTCASATGLCVDLPDTPADTRCEADANLCTNDVCDGAGSCVFSSTTSCPGPTNSCDAGQVCDAGSGACVNLTDPAAGTSCDADGDACTIDECDGAGNCAFVSSVSCPGPTNSCDGGTTCDSASGTCVDNADVVSGTPCDLDGNACTVDTCNGAGACIQTSVISCQGPTGECDAGQVCDAGTGACVDLTDPSAGTICERDGDLCTNDVCNGSGSCVLDSTVDCSGLTDQCNTGVCEPGSGSCSAQPVAAGTSCEADDSLCTNDACDGAGACVQVSAISCQTPTGECDAGQVCEAGTGACVDLADPTAGTPCERDADLCTIDACDGNGSCVLDSVTDCSSLTDQCNTGVCDPGTGSCGAQPIAAGTTCEADGDLCTSDECNGVGACVTTSTQSCPGPTGECDAGQACDTQTGSCEDLADPIAGTPCERDGNLCTTDTCNGAGSCTTDSTTTCPGSTGPCDAGEQCDPGTGDCIMLLDPPLSTPCEVDGDLCSIEHCNGAGQCVVFDAVLCPGPTEACDGGTACNSQTGACDTQPETTPGTACEADGNLCTNDVCDGGGSCVLDTTTDCSGLTDQCNTGVCDESTGDCNAQPVGAGVSCEADGNLCTIDECDGSGACSQASAVVCQGSTGECDAGQVCEAGTGNCVNLTDPAAGTLCENDGNLCTNDTCNGSGDCVLSSTTDCSSLTDQCNTGVCDTGTGGCITQPVGAGTACEADGNLCTIDACDGAGACQTTSTTSCPGSTGECDAGQACNTLSGNCEDLTDPSSGTFCEADGNLCTNDVCDGVGNCGLDSVTDCSSLTDQCNVGVCDSGNGLCFADPVAVGTLCESDGTLCTRDQCDGAGACVTIETVTCLGSTGECDAGQVCNDTTGKCDNLPDPLAGTVCDADGNACTLDECDGAGGCLNVGSVSCAGPVPPCENGQACDPGSGLCIDLPDVATGTECEADSDACTNDACDGNGNCLFVNNVTCPGPVPPCESGSACDSVTGGCTPLPDAEPGTTCEADGNLCTLDACDGAGNCLSTGESLSCAGPTGECDSGQRCATATGTCMDVTDPAAGTSCENDGDFCTIDECDGAGNCASVGDVPCVDDGSFCSGQEVCNPTTGLCASAGNPCTGTGLGTCCEDSNTCVTKCCSNADCNDGNACTADTCTLGACRFTNVCGACCVADGICLSQRTDDACASSGGFFRGTGSSCFGDSDDDGADDLCVPRVVPAASAWGVAILVLAMLAGLMLKFGRASARSEPM